MKIKIEVDGEEREIEADRQGEQLHVTVGEQSATLRLLHAAGGRFVLEWQQPDGSNRVIHAAGYGDSDQRYAWVNGRSLTYRRVRERAVSAAADVGSLSASIPAVVSEILVQPGDRVAAGEKLILLESMKMVIPIQAPYAGTITGINCTAGESVQAGVPLVDMEQEA